MNEEDIQPRRGRPRLGADEGKRYTIAIRTTKDLRDRLKRASEVSGRSMAREIERRLEQSFDEQELGRDSFRISGSKRDPGSAKYWQRWIKEARAAQHRKLPISPASSVP